MQTYNNLDNKITIVVKPTINKNCSKIVATPGQFVLGRGFCFRIELLNPLDLVIDKKFLWIEGEIFNNWPVGNVASDLAYFKPFILAKANAEEEE